ncbi:MAG: oligosaccharide flippase family protein [Bacilli bacterium]|nr:oligosaccharide flippase family protein [Bacilli bacterium]
MHETTRTNVIVNLTRTIVLTILSFITFPFVCRVLGDKTIGLYTWANTFVYYFLILARISIPNFAIRECVRVRDDKKALSKKAQEFFILQSITTLLSFALMLIFVFSVPELFTNREIIFILSINFLTGVFSFEWIYIALEKHFYMAMRSIVILTISAICIFIFVKYPEDIYLYAFFTVGVTVLTVLSNIFYLPNFISFKKEGSYDFKSYIKPLLVLFSISVVFSLYNQSDTFILGFLNADKAEVGSYSVGLKGVDVIIAITTSLSVVFMPRASFYYQLEDKSFFHKLTKYSINITLFIAIPAIASMATLSEPITRLISGNYLGVGGDFQESWTILTILASLMVTYSIGDIIYTQVLIPMKREKIYLYTILIGAALDIILSIILGLYVFKTHPAIGVALATAVTDAFIIVFLLIKTWKWTGHAIFNRNNLKIFALGVAVALVCVFIGPMLFDVFLAQFNNNYTSAYLAELISTVAISGVIYLVGLLLLKEDLVSSFVRKK